MAITIKPTRVFQELWKEQSRVNALRGGARSSKTWSVCQAIALWLATGSFGKQEIRTGTCSIVRETLPALKQSVYQDFINILHEIDLYRFCDHRKTSLEIEFQKRVVRFFSTDDLYSAKLRGTKHTIFYMNEANTIPFESFNQMIMRTSHFCIIDYNPAGSEDNWVRKHVEIERPKSHGDVKLDVSTYKDNIDNLPSETVREIEALKHTDEDLYKVYSRGEWVKSRAIVFPKIHLVDTMPLNYEREYFGIDYGYNDPSVCVRVLQRENELFIEELFYSDKMLITDIVEKLLFIRGRIYSEHGQMREEIKSRGIKVKSARKGKGSIERGITYIRAHKIHVLSSSINTVKEFRNYSYKKDRTGRITDEPVDFMNHAIDATRYALSYASTRKVKII